MSTWIKVCELDDIPPQGSRVVTQEAGKNIALFRTADDQVFALLDKCPHKGGPLSQGLVFSDRVVCPLHNLQIGLGNGCAIAPDEGTTPKFSIKMEGRTIFLNREELSCPAGNMA